MAGIEIEKKINKKHRYIIISIIILAILVVSLVAGIVIYNQNASESGLTNITIAAGTSTCDAAAFVAYQNGYFTQEGLNVTLVQVGWNDLESGLDSGKISASVAAFNWFEPIQQGLHVVLTAGLHTGCAGLVTPANSTVKTLADLQGKSVGVDSIGGPSQLVLIIRLKQLGIDPNSINWVVYPPDQMNEAVSKGEIVAYITWDPFVTEAVLNDGYVSLFNLGTDAPFNTTYCCFVGVNSDLAKNHPATAAAITKAFLMGAEWVREHPQGTAQIEVNDNYIGGTIALNTALLESYNWETNVTQAGQNVQWWISEQTALGVLDPNTNVTALYNQSFNPLVTDSDIPTV